MKTHLTSVIPRRAHHRYLYTSIQPIYNAYSHLNFPLFFDTQVPPISSPPTTRLTPTSSKHSTNNTTSLLLPFLPPSPSPFLQSSVPSTLFTRILAPYESEAEAAASQPATGTSSGPSWRFDSGAYGIPKTRKGKQKMERPVGDDIVAGFDVTPGSNVEPLDLAVQVGEDSYFLRPDSLGVADGVGGWSHTKSAPTANSALFSRRLMHNCSAEIASLHQQHIQQQQQQSSASTSSLLSDVDPVDILQKAYEKALHAHNKSGLLGSSTALLAILTSSPPSPTPSSDPPLNAPLLLRIAHIGDSSLLLIRHNQIHLRTTEMQHSFNYPFQLGPRSRCTPREHARGIEVGVKEGDVVVVASDGMGDNLWEEEVLEEVRMWVGKGGESNLEEGIYDVPEGSAGVRLVPQMLSEAIARRARIASEGSGDEGGDVPFGVKARENGVQFSGGKEDDITVLVAVVSGRRDFTFSSDAHRTNSKSRS